MCVCESGSGQLTALAECDLLDELGWVEPHTAAVYVCVRVRESERERENERGKKKVRTGERHLGLPVCQLSNINIRSWSLEPSSLGKTEKARGAALVGLMEGRGRHGQMEP